MGRVKVFQPSPPEADQRARAALDRLELNWETNCTFEQILFIVLFQCLQKTINECENKSRVYNTEMPLALVSPHLRCLKTSWLHFFFFLNLFRIECLKNKESREGGRDRER